MSSTTQTRPVVTLYPSAQEDVNAYMAAIRLASSVRNSMDAQKAGVDGEKATIYADSFGRHHPNISPPPSANGGHDPDSILNQTSSAHSALNITKSGVVASRDRYPSPNQSMNTATTPIEATLEALKRHHGQFPPPDASMSTPTLESTAAHTPAGIKPEALDQHHGRFPPPEPPTSPNQAPPAKPTSGPTRPIPINTDQSPAGIPPECQLYATNTKPNNVTFALCPVAKRTTNPKHNLASPQLYPGDISTAHTLATRDTTLCDAPTGLPCGQFDIWLVLAVFVLLSAIGLACMTLRKRRTRSPDEENGTASWPRRSAASTDSLTANPKPRASKVSTDSSEAKLRENDRKAHVREQWSQEEFGAERYEPVAWRRGSRRAARASFDFERCVEHDAGPVAALPSHICGGACLSPF